MFLTKGYKDTFYLVYTDEATGKRTRVSTGTTSKKEAKKFRDNFSNKAPEVSNVITLTPSITISELRVPVFEYLRANNYAKQTQALYSHVFDSLIHVLGDMRIDEIKGKDIEKYKNKRSLSVSMVSINIELRKIKALFSIAIALDLLKVNPAKGVNYTICSQTEKKTISEIEFEKLLSVIENETFKNFVIFGYYTGCRLSEIINLDWSDVNLANRTIIIRNKPTFKTKTGRIREIPISEKLFSLLVELPNYTSLSLVFPNSKGFRFDKDNIGRMFSNSVKKTNLSEEITFHCLRHTFITSLLRKGISIYLVKELSGHSDIKTTEGYAHLVTEDLRSAVNCL
jgi:integrase